MRRNRKLSKKQREAQTFANWCAYGALFDQTSKFDHDIVHFLRSVMAEPEAISIDNVTLWSRWVWLHKPRLRWSTKLEWERVQLTARAMWRAYQNGGQS